MWLVVTTLAAIVVTAIWYTNDKARETYKIGFLNLILWGTAIMVFVDHVMGYVAEGGEFIEITPEAILLSVILLISALIIWEIFLFIKDPKGLLKTLKWR
ncbi:MAG TPA: hypothetical protein ENI33_07185 [Thermoplasmatales archaeon]|nr:hypothetical protein [Thermoplasmatales archaeon]